MPLVGLVAGRVGVGKTTVCQRLAALMRERGWRVGGILTPAIYDERGRKSGIAIVDLHTGRREVLARVGDDLGGPRIGPYSFAAEALAWGCRLLEEAWQGGFDLVIVDEIGPLELDRGEGFISALHALEGGVVPRTLAVVRDTCLEALQRRVRERDAPVFWVTEESRENLFEGIARELGLEQPGFDRRGTPRGA